MNPNEYEFFFFSFFLLRTIRTLLSFFEPNTSIYEINENIQNIRAKPDQISTWKVKKLRNVRVWVMSSYSGRLREREKKQI